MYRDDLAAATARRDALGQELARLQTKLVDHEATQAQVRALTAELADVSRQIEQARRKVSLPLLDRVSVSTPCKEPWAKMQGSDQVRHCGRCDKDVYNLSAMTGEEAETLLGARGDLCVRFFRRPDGTVLTSDCPVGARTRRRRRLVVTAVAVAAGALGVTWALRDHGGAVAGATIPTPMAIESEPRQGGLSYDDYLPAPAQDPNELLEVEGKMEIRQPR